MTDRPETTADPLADLDWEPEQERCAYCGKVLPVIGTYGGQPVRGHLSFDECELEKVATDGVP